MAEPGEGSFAGMSEAQRNAIVAALLAQAQQTPTTMYGDSVAGDPNLWPADPSDPADYSAAPATENAGFVSNAPGHLADALSNPEGTFGAVVGNPNAGMPSPGYNAPTTSDLTAQAPTGNFGPAPTGSRTSADFAAAFDAVAQGQPAGLPAGFFNTGFNTPGETISGAPAQTAQAQPGGMPVGFAITGPTNNPSTAFSQNTTFGPPTSAFTAAPAGPGISVGDAIAADVGSLSALNADVNAAVNAAYGPGEVTGPTAGPVAGPSTGNVATDVGVGIGLGISGGYGGATGDGTSGATAASDAAGTGVGIGGASTGISGGPGGTGEGGANTGEGGVGSGPGGGGGGGDGGK